MTFATVSYGSWVLATWTKTKGALRTVSSAAGLVFDRGREAYLSYLEAESRLRSNQATLAGIEAAKAQFDLQKSQLDYMLEFADRIGGPEVKEQIRQRILGSVDALTLDDPNEKDARARLTGLSS
jgi:hypothetical protein